MTKLLWKVAILSTAAILIASAGVRAEKMDASTHSMVIDKLERAMDLMDKDAPERAGVNLRLADLYADRARLKALEEGKKSCEDCEGAKADRSKAISYYQAAFPKIKGDEQGKILVQMAHLDNLNGDSDKAVSIYKNVIKKGRKTFTSEVVGASYFNIAEIDFRNGDFKKAKSNFEKALNEDVANRAFIEYRMSWCDFNLGHPEQARDRLVRILSTPSMVTDPTFREDISRDLPTFIAHGEVSAEEIRLVQKLSPEKTRKGNLYQLGTETDRLGKKSSSLLVWAAYAREGDIKDDDRVEIQIRMAQSQYDLGQTQAALASYSTAIESWRTLKCNDVDKDKCEENQKRLRAFVLNWNKAQKIKPTKELLQAYMIYLRASPNDAEMTQWAALVAREVKSYGQAVELFKRSAMLAKNDKKATKVLEGSLLGVIEMAEASKDLKLRDEAYTFYLDNDPQGAKAFEARFERANVWYQQGKNQQAFSEFHFVATTGGPDHHEIKLKAADLALDCLVLLKDDKSLEVRAKEYAAIFPERQKEYAEIARKATLNLVASNLNNKNVDRSTYVESLEKLKSVNLIGAKDEDKVKYWKNRITLALQAKDLHEVTVAADGLLSVSKLSESDRDYAYSQLEWVAELQLNFPEAYKHAKKLKYVHLSPADRDLRLAFLADLSGADSRPHYEDYLHHEKDLRARNLTRVTLVQRSRQPWRELERQLADLKRTPDLLAPLVLETFGRDRNLKAARQVLAQTRIRGTPTGRILAHQVDGGDFEYFKHMIGSARLNAANDTTLQKTLTHRLSLLNDAGFRLKRFSHEHDYTMEVASLKLLARENRRLGDDLLQLRAPRSLNAQQKQQYHQILQAKANGFLMQAARIEAQWQSKFNSGTFADLEREYQAASPETQNVLRGEVQLLTANAPDGAKSRLQSIVNERRSRPSQREIVAAQLDLQKDPFDRSRVERLRELEKQAGQTIMVSYLDARLSQMKKGTTL